MLTRFKFVLGQGVSYSAICLNLKTSTGSNLKLLDNSCENFHNLSKLLSMTHNRAPDKVLIFISKMPKFSPNPMLDHLLESSHRDDSNKRSNMGFGEGIT